MISKQLFIELKKLYQKQLQVESDDYLAQHADNNSIWRTVESFSRYQQYLPASGNILDWGCNHAPDSCLLRSTYGEHYKLFGCDFRPEDKFGYFMDHSQLEYTRLTHAYSLPYADTTFDLVIGSGVLEHTPFDNESLKELYRVLAPGGVLVVTFLPNRYSLSEAISRLLSLPHHERLYSRREIVNQLKHSGFLPLNCRYHQFLPANIGHEIFEHFRWLNTLGEKFWPLNRLCGTHIVIGKKVAMFG